MFYPDIDSIGPKAELEEFFFERQTGSPEFREVVPDTP